MDIIICKEASGFKAQLHFAEDSEANHVISCDLEPLRPAPHQTVTFGNLPLTHVQSLLCLVGYDGLEKDAGRAHKVCRAGGEHFMSTCLNLSANLLINAPLCIQHQLPRPTVTPVNLQRSCWAHAGLMIPLFRTSALNFSRT